MSKNLVIVSHPNTESLTYHVYQSVVEVLNCETRVHDLYRECYRCQVSLDDLDTYDNGQDYETQERFD